MVRVALLGWLLLLMLYVTELPAASLLPELPKAKAKATTEFGCIEALPEMRRNHMEKMLHQRDQTMRRGVRTKEQSLAQCINCHVSADSSGEFPRHTSSKHFCGACHQFAGVSIDCFECHTDKPDPKVKLGIKDISKQKLLSGRELESRP